VTPAHATPVIVTLPAEIGMANDRGVSRQRGADQQSQTAALSRRALS
jgi:hypothetical protein